MHDSQHASVQDEEDPLSAPWFSYSDVASSGVDFLDIITPEEAASLVSPEGEGVWPVRLAQRGRGCGQSGEPQWGGGVASLVSPEGEGVWPVW